MEFRDDRCAMQLLLPMAKLADKDWEGIAIRVSSGLADGKRQMISMLNTLLKPFLDLSGVESAIPLALKYVAVSGHEASPCVLNTLTSFHDHEAVHMTVYQCNPGGDEYSRKLRGLADE